VRCLPSLCNRTAMTKNILGISAGTKYFGYAIMRNEELVDWRVKALGGKWSKLKLRILARAFARLLDQNIDCVAFKTTPLFRSSENLVELNTALSEIAFQKNIPRVFCSTEKICETVGVRTKPELVKTLSQTFPELSPCAKDLHTKCDRNDLRLFEAIACALCCLQRG
jgi:hypothetical protein